MEISGNIKLILKEIKRIQPKIQKVPIRMNPVENIYKRSRGYGNTNYLLEACSKNNKVILVVSNEQYARQLRTVFKNKYPTTKEPLIMGIERAEREGCRFQLPMLLDLSSFDYQDETYKLNQF